MSESNKFTPGPWLYRGKSNSVHESCSTHPFGHTIFVFDDDAPLRDPDLSLILAAPDLLEALEAILPFVPRTSASEGGASKYSENVKAADMVRAAINKARNQQ